MQKYYDNAQDRLVFSGHAATSIFWDSLWENKKLNRDYIDHFHDRLVAPTTKKYLTPNKSIKILEGGCGRGIYVNSLFKAGYDAYGVDYAPTTIRNVKRQFPRLKLKVADVRKLPFKDNFFDGYWSLGVIEHFFDGYDPIAKEIARVLLPGGYLFLTFPHISLLRRLKIKLGLYPKFKKSKFDQKNFYQFAFNHNQVIHKFNNYGLFLIHKNPLDGLKGLKDEVGFLKPVLQRIYDSTNFFARLIAFGLMIIMTHFSSHTVLLVFKKQKTAKN